MSAFLDSQLQPLAAKVKSFVKDTNDFLYKLNNLGNIPRGAILCSVDVVGLYPNIPHDEGLLALKEALDKRVDKNISTDSLVEIAECVLKNNFFEHNGEVYKQEQGTAIGTKMAPSYAILFMDKLEREILDSCTHKPEVWWRYIDDVFFVWRHGEEKLHDFIRILNSSHRSIKFTYEFSKESLNFLDVMVHLKNGKVETDLFTKPTDTHQFLHASSCHVYHTKKAIPYSQALRLNRICSKQEYFDKRCNDLEAFLLKRGYKAKLVREQVLRARRFKREDLLRNTVRHNNRELITLNIAFHPALSKLGKVLRDIHILLTPDREHQMVFKEVPMIGFRRAKSLKDILVRAKLPQSDKTNTGRSLKCGSSRCKVCDFIKETADFKSTNNNNVYKIMSEMDCNSKNVIYLNTCKTCQLQYVGSTTTKFRIRFNNYKSGYKRFLSGKTDIPQAMFFKHFKENKHNGIEDWEIRLIEKCENLIKLRKRESFWQFKLNTFSPAGLNEKFVPIT